MAFRKAAAESAFEGDLGPGKVTILGASGLRLTGLGSFWLDEGPDFAWLNIYRTLCIGRQLEITRERPAVVEADGDAVVVRWKPSEEVNATLSARYQLVQSDSAVDVEFAAELEQDYPGFELFIANYFTPQFRPRYAVADNLTHPEGVFWYQKQWYGDGENELWARDEAAEGTFADGRWIDGYPLNWRRGPQYAYPLMTQEHRNGLANEKGAIVIMARRPDCYGISGFNSYHNSQYLHLGGNDARAGERVAFVVRMVLLVGYQDLQTEALALYDAWTEGGA